MIHSFLFNAFLAALSSSVASGIVGSYIVVRRIVFLAGGIAHSVLGGMGIFLFLSRTYDLPYLTPTLGAFVSAVISAWIIGIVHMRYKEREDTSIAAVWAIGMSLGVIFLAITPGYNVEMSSYLFGNLLWATKGDIFQIFILDAILAIIAFIFHKKFLLVCFDEKQAKLQKIAVKRLYFLLLMLTALTIVALIKVVGAILLIAFLCLPAAQANFYTHRLSRVILGAIGLAIANSIIGIFCSYFLNIPPGACIALVTSITYSFGLIFKQAKSNFNLNHRKQLRKKS